MNPGFGNEVPSTKPLTREERRQEAARVKAEREAAAALESDQTKDDSTPETNDSMSNSATKETAATAETAVVLEPKNKARKTQFGTQLHPGTITRIDWIKNHGYSVTDTVDAAINDYLDRAGIPRPGRDGRMPD